jgi:hypothetical protein
MRRSGPRTTAPSSPLPPPVRLQPWRVPPLPCQERKNTDTDYHRKRITDTLARAATAVPPNAAGCLPACMHACMRSGASAGGMWRVTMLARDACLRAESWRAPRTSGATPAPAELDPCLGWDTDACAATGHLQLGKPDEGEGAGVGTGGLRSPCSQAVRQPRHGPPAPTQPSLAGCDCGLPRLQQFVVRRSSRVACARPPLRSRARAPGAGGSEGRARHARFRAACGRGRAEEPSRMCTVSSLTPAGLDPRRRPGAARAAAAARRGRASGGGRRWPGGRLRPHRGWGGSCCNARLRAPSTHSTKRLPALLQFTAWAPALRCVAELPGRGAWVPAECGLGCLAVGDLERAAMEELAQDPSKVRDDPH